MHSTSLWLFAPWATSEQKSSKCKQRQLISILSINYNFAKTNHYNQSLYPRLPAPKAASCVCFPVTSAFDLIGWCDYSGGFTQQSVKNSVNEKLLGLFWAAKERLRAAEFHRAVIRPVIGLGDLKTAKIERRFRSQRLLLTDTTFQSRENIPLKPMFLISLKVCALIKECHKNKLAICCVISQPVTKD